MRNESDLPEPLVVFGGGTLARLACAYFLRDSAHELAACTVNREYVDSARLDGLPTVPFEDLERSHPPSEFSLFVALGYTDVNRRRAQIFEEAVRKGYQLPTLVSSHSHCWDDLRIGRNCLVFDGVVIEPGVELGDDVIAWSGSQISHDTSVGSHCFLGPNAVVLGDVVIGERAFVGANATIRNGVHLAEDCVVGAGALVKRDTAPGDVYSAERTQPRRDHNAREGVQL